MKFNPKYIWVIVPLLPFLFYQNCGETFSTNAILSSVNQSSFQANTGSLKLEVDFIDSSGQVWKHTYNPASDLIVSKIVSSPIMDVTNNNVETVLYSVMSVTNNDHCEWGILREAKIGNSYDSEYMIVSCVDKASGRVFISHQERERSGQGEWSSPQAQGFVCNQLPCPNGFRSYDFKGSGGSNWSHFVTQETDGSFNAYSNRYSPVLYPVFAASEKINLVSGDNISTTVTGTVQSNNAPYSTTANYNLSSLGGQIVISHSAIVNGVLTSNSPMSHGIINMN